VASLVHLGDILQFWVFGSGTPLRVLPSITLPTYLAQLCDLTFGFVSHIRCSGVSSYAPRHPCPLSVSDLQVFVYPVLFFCLVPRLDSVALTSPHIVQLSVGFLLLSAISWLPSPHCYAWRGM